MGYWDGGVVQGEAIVVGPLWTLGLENNGHSHHFTVADNPACSVSSEHGQEFRHDQTCGCHTRRKAQLPPSLPPKHHYHRHTAVITHFFRMMPRSLPVFAAQDLATEAASAMAALVSGPLQCDTRAITSPVAGFCT